LQQNKLSVLSAVCVPCAESTCSALARSYTTFGLGSFTVTVFKHMLNLNMLYASFRRYTSPIFFLARRQFKGQFNVVTIHDLREVLAD